MKKYFTFIALCALISGIAYPLSSYATDTSTEFPPNLEKTPTVEAEKLSFRENKGQWSDNILYKLNIKSLQLYAERGQLTWAVHNIDDLKKRAECSHATGKKADCKEKVRSHGFRMKFLNSNSDHGHSAANSSTSYSNYFLGNNKDKWATNVRNYRQIQYSDLYDGIDFKMYSRDERLKFEFILEPNINPDQIKIKFEGVEELNIVNGNLYIVTSVNEIKELKPYAYQDIGDKRVEVKCNFKLNGNILTYEFPNGFSAGHKLVIDPTLVFASYSGSTADNWGMTATPGPNGEFYGGGIVFGQGYPTIGAYDSTFGLDTESARVDMGITKYTADGSNIIYSTYIGGANSDIPHSIIVNSQGELVILGSTSSDNYPTTFNAYDRTFNGGGNIGEINGIIIDGSDIVVSVLSESGDVMEGSTFMGGSQHDGVIVNDIPMVYNYGDQIRGEVVVDDQDNIYVASVSRSSDFPTKSAFQSSFSGLHDGVVFSLNSNVSNLRWSSFYGGTSHDAAYSIKIDENNNVVFGGGTMSDNIRTTSGTFSPNFNGGIVDGYISKISNNGSTFISGTYVGTSSYDQIYFLYVDDENQVYSYGQTKGNMSISPGAYHNDGGGLFINRFNQNLSVRNLSTLIGSGDNIVNLSPTAFLVDECERIYISGWGGNVNSAYNEESTTNGLPITSNAIQKETDGSDFYFLVLEYDARSLLYSTYFGGYSAPDQRGAEHVDGGTSRFSEKGAIYQTVCAGCGGSDIFPVTSNAARTNLLSPNCNMGVIKFDFELTEILAGAELGADTVGCAPFTVDFENLSYGTSEFQWSFGDGEFSNEYEPQHTYTSPGTYEVELVAISNNPCLPPDTAYLEVRVKEATEDISETIVECEDSTITLSSRIEDPGASFQWNTGSSDQEITVDESGVYYVITRLSNCVFKDSFNVTINTPESRIVDMVQCDMGNLILEVDEEAENIEWNTGSNAQSIEVGESGTYWVTYNINSCNYADTAKLLFPDLPRIQARGNSLACAGDTILFEVENISDADISEYQWNGVPAGNSFEVTSTGEYVVEGITESGCVDADTLDIYFIPELPPLELPDSTVVICKDSEITFDLSEYQADADISWSDGSTSFQRTITESGKYSVNIRNTCENLHDELILRESDFNSNDLPVYIPNAFTPNSDGVNDSFKPLFNPDVKVLSLEFEVFDRWGNKVFRSENKDLGWRGMFKDQLMDPAVFMWTLDVRYFTCEVPASKELEGDVSILK